MEDLEESKICPVCLEPGKSLCQLQPCQHEFCQSCVASLTEQSLSPEFLCPLCRTPIKKSARKFCTNLRPWICCFVILLVFVGFFVLLYLNGRNMHQRYQQKIKTSLDYFDDLHLEMDK